MAAYKNYTVEDVRIASSKRAFTVISCFAGGGGSSIGYRLAGGHVLLINEFVESAIESYHANFPDTPVLSADIKTYSAKDFLESTKLSVGELDILDGSPPCSAFSVVGKRERGWNSTKTYSDGKKIENIEDLFFEFVRIADGVQPKIIVAENVKGITFGAAKKKLNQILNAFQSIGYTPIYRVLNSVDYGTPQRRERAIFVAIRNDVYDACQLNPLTMDHYIYPDIDNRVVTLGEALSGVDNDTNEVKMLIDYAKYSWENRFLQVFPKNPDKLISASDAQFAKINPNGSYFSMVRCSYNLPAPTVTQRGCQLSVAGLIHPTEDRKFTINELKRIMGFPDDYMLCGSFNQKAERLGRAVAPKMYQALISTIYNNILKTYNEHHA